MFPYVELGATVGLVDQKMGTSGVDKAGRTPLHYAAFGVDDRLAPLEPPGVQVRVRALVEAGADVNATDSCGMRPLYFAAMRRSTIRGTSSVVGVLISGGAEVDALDSHGNTPLSNAVCGYRATAG